MGYYTNFNMTVYGLRTEDDAIEISQYLVDNGIAEYSLSSDYAYLEPSNERAGVADFWSNGEVKWYSYTEDMTQLAQRFPDFTFMLHGRGEDLDDIWDEYYKGDKIETCRWIIKRVMPTVIDWYEKDGGIF